MAQRHEVAALPAVARIAGSPGAGVDALLVEACRTAWVNLGGPSVRSAGVTSAMRGEGRTTIALGMAMAQWQEYGRRALLVEFDFERPSLAERLGLEPAPGLAEFLHGKVPMGAIVQPAVDGLTVITAGVANGPVPLLLTEVLRQRPFQDLVGWDILIGDLPPILVSGFARLAVPDFERTVIVVRAGVTPLAVVREATTGFPEHTAFLLNGTYSKLPRWLRRLTGS